MAAGMGNWDEFVRTGGWDVDARLPMALEVEAADRVMAAGRAVSGSHAVRQILIQGYPRRRSRVMADMRPRSPVAQSTASRTYSAFGVPARA